MFCHFLLYPRFTDGEMKRRYAYLVCDHSHTASKGKKKKKKKIKIKKYNDPTLFRRRGLAEKKVNILISTTIHLHLWCP